MSEGLLPTIARFVTKVSYNDIPFDVTRQAKRLILDTIGVGLAGYVTETGQVVRSVIDELGGKPESTIIVSGDKTSCANAAFANAKMANALDMDDCFANLVHFAPMTIFVPLAMAERLGAGGKDVLTAVTVGYDIAARIGLYGGHTFFTDSMMFVCHIFGGTAGAGKLLKLNEKEMMNAIGTAAAFAPIPLTKKCASPPVTWVKYSDAGLVAWAGIVSCLLAKTGYQTNPTLFEGDDGYWVAMRSTKPNYEALTDQLGQKWWIMDSALKPYPSCRYNHNPVDMFKNIVMENNLKPEGIESVTFKCAPYLASPERQWSVYEPRDSYGAQFSIPHCIAMVAFNVPIGPQWQAPENIHDPKVNEFRHKVKFEGDPKVLEVISSQKDELIPRRMPISIELIANGKVYRESRDMSKGDPWSPETRYSDAEVKTKFVMNASNVFNSKKSDQIIEMVDHLEELENVSTLMKLLVL